MIRNLKKSLHLRKSLRRDIRSSAGLYFSLFEGAILIFFLAYASLSHISIILTESCLTYKPEADPCGDSKICRYMCPQILKFTEYLALFQLGFADSGYVSTTVNAVIAKWSGPEQALVGNKLSIGST